MADHFLMGVDDKVLITLCCGAVMFFIGGLLTLSRYQTNDPPRPEPSRGENHHTYNTDVCPICLGIHKLAVETTCGHKFCGTCLSNCLNQSKDDFSPFGIPTACPLCRQIINIVLISFSQEDSAAPELEDERRFVETTIHEYNIRFGNGPRDFSSYVRDCPVLIRHMFYDFFTFGGLVWLFRVRVVLCFIGAIIYVFNPLDIIPEAVFGLFGFLDDFIVFLLCVVYLSIIYRRLIISRGNASTAPH